MEEKMGFAWVLTGDTSLFMTDCERYGMSYGCDIDCPVLQAGNCELKETDNKELYEQYREEYGDYLDD